MLSGLGNLVVDCPIQNMKNSKRKYNNFTCKGNALNFNKQHNLKALHGKTVIIV